eukprot:EC713359.1.p1 GENE.EC713359.1~~EC713359.1.p1  ORF type:complete len:113 (+),score=10.39 EC713359.1:25-339(+)
MVAEKSEYNSLKEFMPFYRSQHVNRTNRRLHFVGSTLGLIFGLYAILTFQWRFLLVGLTCGYAFAWVGHFFFEKNKPATFKYPVYSFLGDWVIWSEIITLRMPF